MLKIIVPASEFWDNSKQQFIYTKETTLLLEHSLISISKWEAKYHKPFIGNRSTEPRTEEETLEYIKCMTINPNVDDLVYYALSDENIEAINEYIKDPMTATKIKDDKGAGSRSQFITSELIYYWMIAFNIPFECEKWHVERLLTLIRVCNAENAKHNGKKKSNGNTRANLDKMAEMNERRKAALHSKG
jgi:hypothetical protein